MHGVGCCGNRSACMRAHAVRHLRVQKPTAPQDNHNEAKCLLAITELTWLASPTIILHISWIGFQKHSERRLKA
jgi:hypothetical protein